MIPIGRRDFIAGAAGAAAWPLAARAQRNEQVRLGELWGRRRELTQPLLVSLISVRMSGSKNNSISSFICESLGSVNQRSIATPRDRQGTFDGDLWHCILSYDLGVRKSPDTEPPSFLRVVRLVLPQFRLQCAFLLMCKRQLAL